MLPRRAQVLLLAATEHVHQVLTSTGLNVSSFAKFRVRVAGQQLCRVAVDVGVPHALDTRVVAIRHLGNTPELRPAGGPVVIQPGTNLLSTVNLGGIRTMKVFKRHIPDVWV